MTSRTRTALALAASAAATLAVAGPAAAAPSTPVLENGPPFAIGSQFTAEWSAATFTPNSIARGYQLEVEDQTGGGIQLFSVDAPDLDRTVTGRANGHRYDIRVRAVERLCIAVVPGPNPLCLAHSPLVTAGPWSATDILRMDATDPTGSMSINGGATYATSRTVNLTLAATDPPSAGNPASGVSGVQISQDATFTCNIATSTAECPVPVTSPRSYTLDEGPDGARTVRVRYRDNARVYGSTGLVLATGASGNASTDEVDSIILDRSQPTPVVVTGVPTADAGVPVAFSASSSTDATSGINPASAVWNFGDGTAPVNALQLNKAFAAPGTYNGTLTISDKAGNTNSQAFSFTVTGAAAPGGGGVVVVDPGTGTPGITPGGQSIDDPIRGAKRLNRAVQGKPLKIRVRLASRVQVRVAILRVASSGKAVVRRQTRTAGPGLVVFTFVAPKAGRHIVRVTAGSDRLTFPMGIARR